MQLLRLCIFGLFASASLFGAERGGNLLSGTPDERKHFTLRADATWQLTPPRRERFDASGLAFWRGRLLTINDRGSELYEIAFRTNGTADLKPTPFFPHRAVSAAAPKRQPRYDGEGITVDSEGNLYFVEEEERAIYRTPPDGSKVERLAIDWAPVRKYFGRDVNASFEGVAVSPAQLFVANERDAARIIVVDRATLVVSDSFSVDSATFAFGGPHYSDLSFRGGHLYVLDRNHRVILEVEPKTRRVVAEYNFSAVELADAVAYKTVYPTGTMEGLAVDDQYFWLVTDNNGLGRIKQPGDPRPTLFRCPKPGGQD